MKLRRNQNKTLNNKFGIYRFIKALLVDPRFLVETLKKTITLSQKSSFLKKCI